MVLRGPDAIPVFARGNWLPNRCKMTTRWGNMNRSVNRFGAVLLASAALVLSGCEKEEQADRGAAPQTGEVRWRMASSFSSTLPLIGTMGVLLTENLQRVSSGGIRLEFIEPGKLVAPLEVFDAVSQGQIEAGWTAAVHWTRKIPAAALFSALPFGPDTVEFLAWIYEGEGWALWKEIYAGHNVYPIPCSVVPPEASGWFREPVTRLEQFQGMKIRFFGLGGQAVRRLGASVQLLAGADIYLALERGILDATEFSIPVIDEKMRFDKIARHYYFPGWHQQASLLELIINLERWNELPVGDRALIEMACRDLIVHSIARGEASQRAAIAAIRRQGVQIHYWPDEMLRAFKQAYEEVVKEMRVKDEDFRRVHDAYLKFREGYAEWARLSRLPEGL